MKTEYDDEICEWYATDLTGHRHYRDTPWGAREAANEANRVISEHLIKCPDDLLSDDWMIQERDQQAIYDEEERMYTDLRYGG